MTTRVVHFEIPVDDPARAAGFYRSVLGWDTRRLGDIPYWNIADDVSAMTGAAGALTLRSDAPDGVLIYVAVDDLDAVLERVVASGGAVVSGRSEVVGVGAVARFRDSEGNVVGLLQPT